MHNCLLSSAYAWCYTSNPGLSYLFHALSSARSVFALGTFPIL